MKLSDRLNIWWYKFHDNFNEEDCLEMEDMIKEVEKMEKKK